MRIENSFEVPFPVEDVWTYIQDIPRTVPCMPGAELTEQIDQNNFEGRLNSKMGPVSLTFTGTAQIIERNDGAKKMVVKASGSEASGKGQAELEMTTQLHGTGGGTRVTVTQDLQMSGAAAQYGRGMISDVTSVLMKQFADCIKDDIDRAQRGEGPVQRAASPVGGMSVGFQAFLTAIKRFFGKFFGGGR